jgi:hypothetical protein
MAHAIALDRCEHQAKPARLLGRLGLALEALQFLTLVPQPVRRTIRDSPKPVVKGSEGVEDRVVETLQRRDAQVGADEHGRQRERPGDCAEDHENAEPQRVREQEPDPAERLGRIGGCAEGRHARNLRASGRAMPTPFAPRGRLVLVALRASLESPESPLARILARRAKLGRSAMAAALVFALHRSGGEV